MPAAKILKTTDTPLCEACGNATVNIVIRGVAVYSFLTCSHCGHHTWSVDGSTASLDDVVAALADERPPTTGALSPGFRRPFS